MNVVFLDYDGVEKTPMWKCNETGKWYCSYNFPSDGKVNDFQAVQWVSEFCQKYNYSIVVSSTWRSSSNYKECLKCGGLRQGIEILGKTPEIWHDDVDGKEIRTYRGEEISQYLNEHPEVDNYLIFDDDSDMTVHMDKLVKCNGATGFKCDEYHLAETLHQAFNTDYTGIPWIEICKEI